MNPSFTLPLNRDLDGACTSSFYPDPGNHPSKDPILDESFLLPLDGQIYDVSNLSPANQFRLKRPPPRPPRSSKKMNDSPLYPHNWTNLLIQMEHENEGSLDRLRQNWNACNRRRNTYTASSSEALEDDKVQDFDVKKNSLQATTEDCYYTVVRRESCPELPYARLITVGDQRVPFYGADATAKAIHEGRSCNTYCVACRAPLTCIQYMTYVICPVCQSISPAKALDCDSHPSDSFGKECTGQSQEEPTLLAVGMGLPQAPRRRTTSIASRLATTSLRYG